MIKSRNLTTCHIVLIIFSLSTFLYVFYPQTFYITKMFFLAIFFNKWLCKCESCLCCVKHLLKQSSAQAIGNNLARKLVTLKWLELLLQGMSITTEVNMKVELQLSWRQMEEPGFPVKFWLRSLFISLALSCLSLRSPLPATSWKLVAATQLCLISRVSGGVMLCLQKLCWYEHSPGENRAKDYFFFAFLFARSNEVEYLGESNSKIFLKQKRNRHLFLKKVL